MPQIFLNDINVVKYTEYIVPPSRVAKKPVPELWSLSAFSLIEIDDYNNFGEPNVPLSFNWYNSLALFKPFFTDLMVEKTAERINKYMELHRLAEERPMEREHP